LSDAEKIERLRNFHLDLKDEVQKEGETDYGAYPGDKRYNSDEMGIGFHDNSTHSINFTNAKSVQSPIPGGKPRRFATLCPLFRAEGEQPKKIHIILRGDGTRIKARESKNWDPDVNVLFQKNAWQDSTTWEEMVKGFEIAPNSLLLLDGLGTHKKEECIEYLSERKVKVKIGPAGLTDHWQPADHGLGLYCSHNFQFSHMSNLCYAR